MLILLIGPSGVGKTKLGEYAGKTLNFKFYNLDEYIKPKINCWDNGWQEKYFDYSRQEVEKIKSENNDYSIVDVGAGTIDSKRSRDWLKNFKTISITAPSKEVFERNKYWRDFTGFKEREYSSYRRRIYDSASFKFQVDGLNLEKAKQKFSEFLKTEVLKKF
jgi:shikimate kinase